MTLATEENPDVCSAGTTGGTPASTRTVTRSSRNNNEEITKASNLSDTTRSVHIITTASLPWMTGTAVNPLLRALYFQQSRTSPSAHVTLVIPWVEKKEERLELYGSTNTFSDGKAGRKEQEQYVRDWAANKAGMEKESKELRIQFYPAAYQKKFGSILAKTDICSLSPSDEADIAIMEEPEHLTWLALPQYEKYSNNKKSKNLTGHDDFLPTSDIGWMQKFNHVVGIIHTNYPAYMRSYGVRGSRTLAAKTILGLSILVCRSYCHKIIKLSSTLPILASYKECVSNVHGVRSDFQSAPDEKDKEFQEEIDGTGGDVKAYFIGKIIWAKGFDFLLQCQEKFCEETGDYFPIDIYGGGPDVEKIKRAFHGVRKGLETDNDKTSESNSTSNEMVEPLEDDDDDDETDKKEECSDDTFFSKLTETMLKSMPFLMDEIKKEEGVDEKLNDGTGNNEKNSTIQTIKDGLQLMKKIPKEKFQFDLKHLPKSRFEWRKKAIPARFVGPKDHALLKFSSYKVFVNPSITEVLCTTSAEALAMGKFVVLPAHPSNEFFNQFPNCLIYKDMDEFVAQMKFVMSNEPTKLTPELEHIFTWEAAMDRLMKAGSITTSEQEILQTSGKLMRDERKAWIHKESGRVMKGDVLKNLVGGPPGEALKHYEIGDTSSRSDKNRESMLTFENKNPKVLAFLSFIIAIISYFVQR